MADRGREVPPQELVRGVRYKIRQYSPTQMIYPLSGVFGGIISRRPMFSDQKQDLIGFSSSPKYNQYFDEFRQISEDELVPGNTYRIIPTKGGRKEIRAVFLRYNYTMIFKDVEVLYYQERIPRIDIESNITAFYEIEKNITMSPIKNKNSRKARSYRMKSSRSRRYI
jgi:hypothetical protein